MNKAIIIIGFLSLIFLNKAYPQSAVERKGIKFYELYAYEEAANRLEQISTKSTEVLRMLADSYFKIGKLKQSQNAYADLMLRSDRIPEDIYQYAFVLAANREYSNAKRWMETYANLKPEDSRVERYFLNPGFYDELMKDKGQFSIRSLDFNNKQSDFGAAFWGDKIVFASTRPLSRPFQRLWSRNKLPFLNLYVASIDEDGQFDDIEIFSEKHNTKFHYGPAVFARDGTFMAFTRNNFDASGLDDVIKLNLYTSRRQDDIWSEPEPFSFNSNEYSVGHAAMTPDGRLLFFASDMPGGYGGVDLYASEWKSGKWSEPYNLGPVINTEGDEMFPFIHPEGWLFFSSNGLPGLGSLDVFYSNVSDFKNPSLPINLGVPINSNADDFAFMVDKDFKKGYFSSNREEGKGDDDMYAFNMHFALRKIIRGTTRDADQNVLSQVKVQLINEKDSILQTTLSSEEGFYEFLADKNKKYSLVGSLENYAQGYSVVEDEPGQTETIADLLLERLPEFLLYGIITDATTNEPLERVKIRMVNNTTGQGVNFITTIKGDFIRKLEGISMNDDISFNFTFEKPGYAPRTITYERKLDHEGQFDVHEELDLAMDKLDAGVELGKLLGLNRIVFDKDKADIRPDAAKELDKVAEFMNLYPEMEIELGAHTDCRGFAATNLRLSINRAEMATWYIQGRISNPTRLYHRGYGEIRPVNKCVCEGSRSVPCTEEEHQQNERIEFMILMVD